MKRLIHIGTGKVALRIVVCALAMWLTVSTVQSEPLGEPDEAWASETLASMSLDQKIGQVLCPYILYGQRADDGTSYRNLVRSVTDLHIGAFHIVGGRARETAELINALQSQAEFPLVFTADMEGGLGVAISDATLFPRAMGLASTSDLDLVESCARAAAEEARAVGIGINFYPILDVNTDPGSVIISYRSFGDDPEAVSRYGLAYLRGTQSTGVMATGKHFPGHGHTSVDSHTGLVTIGLGVTEFRRDHLFPFRASIDAGIGAIMIGHILVPSLGEFEKPATLSPRLTADLLRGELGFEGLIVTDAMTMGAITSHYSQEEAAVLALRAGSDLLLFPPDSGRYAQGIRNALAGGDLPPERLDEAARNVLLAKSRLRLHQNRLVDLDQVEPAMKTADHVRLSSRAAAESIVLYRDTRPRLPLRLGEATVTILQIGDLGWYPFTSTGSAFVAEIERRAKAVEVFRIPVQPAPQDFPNLLASAEKADVVFCNTFVTVSAAKDRLDLLPEQKTLVEALHPFEDRTVLVAFGSPYVVFDFPWIECAVIGCDTIWEMQRAAVRSLVGESEFKGELPVRLKYRSAVGDDFGLYR